MPYTVRAGKSAVSCHRKKKNAKAAAAALKRAGKKKVRVYKVKSCG